MAKAGRGAAALATAALGSFVAGTLATIALTLVAPVVADVAVQLGPNDYFALMVVAFVTVGALLGSSVSRGLASLGLGLFLGLVGTDTLTGQQRFTFGVPMLTDGIDVVVVAVGVFAVGEALYVASRLRHGPVRVIPVPKGWRSWMSRSDWSRSWPSWLRGAAIGFPIGTIPAGGADVSTFLSYAVEKKVSRHKEEFGTGCDRRCGRSGGGEQCRGCRCAGTATDARVADDSDRGGDDRGVPELRHPTGTVAVREPGGTGLDTRGQPVPGATSSCSSSTFRWWGSG